MHIERKWIMERPSKLEGQQHQESSDAQGSTPALLESSPRLPIAIMLALGENEGSEVVVNMRIMFRIDMWALVARHRIINP
jgi:hypothetical protein